MGVEFNVDTVVKSAVFCMCWFYLVKPDPPYLPLGRAASSMIGSVILVLSHQLSSGEALYTAIDYGTIVFLAGMMIIVLILEEQRALGLLAHYLLKFDNVIGLYIVSLTTAILSALITNDGTVILLTPFIVKLCKAKNIHPRPYLMAVATSSNLGSAATITGNPQNVIIGEKGGIHWLYFTMIAGPAAIVGLFINAALLHFLYAKELRGETTNPLVAPPIMPNQSGDAHSSQHVIVSNPFATSTKDFGARSSKKLFSSSRSIGDVPGDYKPIGEPDLEAQATLGTPSRKQMKYPRTNKHANSWALILRWVELGITFIMILLLTLAFILDFSVPWVTLAVASILTIVRMIFTRDATTAAKLTTKIFKDLDWELLVFFGAIFVVIEGFQKTGIPTLLWEWTAEIGKRGNAMDILSFSALSMVLSNMVGNVPAVLLMAPELHVNFRWILLSWSATISGNLTLAGSAANIFVDQIFRNHGYSEGLGFWNHMKIGVPSTILSFFAGLGIIIVLSNKFG